MKKNKHTVRDSVHPKPSDDTLRKLEKSLVSYGSPVPKTTARNLDSLLRLLHVTAVNEKLSVQPSLAGFDDALQEYKAMMEAACCLKITDLSGDSHAAIQRLKDALLGLEPDFLDQYTMMFPETSVTMTAREIAQGLAIGNENIMLIGAGQHVLKYYQGALEGFVNGRKDNLTSEEHNVIWNIFGSADIKSLYDTAKAFYPLARSNFEYSKSLRFCQEHSYEYSGLNQLYQRYRMQGVLSRMRADLRIMNPLSAKYLEATSALQKVSLDEMAQANNCALLSMKLQAVLGLVGLVSEYASQLQICNSGKKQEIIIAKLHALHETARRAGLPNEASQDMGLLEYEQHILGMLQYVGTEAEKVVVSYYAQKHNEQLRAEFVSAVKLMGTGLHAVADSIHKLAQRPQITYNSVTVHQHGLFNRAAFKL